jgi:hypothetical protein
MMRILFWIGLFLLGAMIFEAIAEASEGPLARSDGLAYVEGDL